MTTNTFSDEQYRVVMELFAAEEEFKLALANTIAMRAIVLEQLRSTDESIEAIKKRFTAYINEESNNV